jgi:hypothetical protein
MKYVWSYTSVNRGCFYGETRDNFTSLLFMQFYVVEGEYGKYGEEVHTELWKENLEERDHVKDTGIDVRIILIWVLNKVGRRRMY